MGCNYELRYSPCPHCGRADESRHIGKSSNGWCFSLHVYPNESILTLEDWEHEFTTPESKIFDEYGEELTIQEMMNKITKRTHEVALRRHDISWPHVLGHGTGTYDYLVGDFS